MFRQIFLTALIAGAVAGLAVAAVQQAGVIPLIERAEVYEASAMSAVHIGMSGSEGWQPEAGFERVAYTVVADVLTGIGFALLLTGAMALAGLRGHVVDARRGVLWGAAAFAVFTLAPSLGLPPALPGMEAADLAQRQGWWIGTAIATAIGLGLIVFWPTLVYRVIGATLIIIPHAIGAPQTPAEGGGVPALLAARFVVVSMFTAALFWILLGCMIGWIYRRLAPSAASPPERRPPPLGASFET